MREYAWRTLVSLSPTWDSNGLVRVGEDCSKLTQSFMKDVLSYCPSATIFHTWCWIACTEMFSIRDTVKIDHRLPMYRPMYSRKRWKECQYLANQFRSRWRKEYLQSLQKRHKRTKSTPQLKDGDIVLLQDKNCARNEWKIGRITKQSEDGRNITIIANNRTTTRAPRDLVLLIRPEV